MHPLRILVIILLIYLFYKLLAGRKTVSRPVPGGSAGAPVRHDVLVEDPVCHTYVAKGQAISLDQGEKIYYFCSRECRQAFLHSQGEKK